VKAVFLGLSITSSWGNGHATNYRGLLRALDARGHDVLFLERDKPWYAGSRDFDAPYVRLYGSVEELREAHAEDVRDADLVVVGSYVPDGIAVGDWVLATARGTRAFYDIDTPVTLAALARGACDYLSADLVTRYDLYLSFTGGPTLRRLEHEHGARHAVAFYCFADPDLYRPEEQERRWAVGYLGTYSADRQPALERLLLGPARSRPEERFVVAGPQYPERVVWPDNVDRVEHLAPGDHRAFYNAQRFTLNTTRADMRRAGWSPSVRLFEAAACGTPVVSDFWPGLESVFTPGREILIEDTLSHLALDEDAARAIGERARERVLREHTATHRAELLEQLVQAPVAA
jgi:spore maturation protein CgeB